VSRGRRIAALCAALLLALACASLGERVRGRAVAPRAHVALEVWPGFSQRPGASQQASERVEIVLDLTTSMRAAAAPGGPPRYAAARNGALRLVRSLPARTSLGVRALGITRGEEHCAGPFTLQRASRPDPAALAPLLDSVQPASESSLAGALEELRGDLGRSLEGSRVVIFTDLGAECGGDLCAAASQLVAGGARLDLVLLSDAVVPQCFAHFAPEGQPSAAEFQPEPPRADFRVEAYETGAAAAGDVLARGRIDGRPVAVTPGAVTIVLEMRPPSVIGPLVLEEGTLTRVRVLDFPTLDPPAREWRWDVGPFEPSEE
jgi:hypothetical protein